MQKYPRTGIIVFVFLLSISFSACNSRAIAQLFPQAPQSTKLFTPEIHAPNNISATIVSPPIFTPTAKSTRTPTSHPHPSDTPTVSQPANNPVVATQMKMTDQAETLKETEIASFPINCGDLVQNEVSLSPQRNWLAISCGYNHDQTLTIIDRTGKKWVMVYEDYLADEQKADGIPIGGIYPTYWLDEDYLFFSPSIGFSGGGLCRYRPTGQGLFRINLNTGYVSTILPKLTGDRSYILSFSPGGQRLVYDAGIPTIIDLQTGKEITIHVDSKGVGDFTWSPDGSEVAFATCEIDPNTYDINRSSIQIYSVDRQVTRILLEGEEKPFHIFSYSDSMFLVADSEDEDDPEANLWFFDWSVGQLVTPTPKP